MSSFLGSALEIPNREFAALFVPKKPATLAQSHATTSAPSFDSGPHSDSIDDQILRLIPWVRDIAKNFLVLPSAHYELDDLVSAGVIGLMDALRKFDKRRGVPFRAYAKHRIRGAILDYLRRVDWRPRHLQEQSKRAERTYRKIESELGRPPESEELAFALGISLRKWYRIARAISAIGGQWSTGMISAQAKKTNGVEGEPDTGSDPYDVCYEGQKRVILNRALSRLTPRNQMIIRLYYVDGLTMDQIAARLEIHQSRVSQLHAAALKKLARTVRKALGRLQYSQ